MATLETARSTLAEIPIVTWSLVCTFAVLFALSPVVTGDIYLKPGGPTLFGLLLYPAEHASFVHLLVNSFSTLVLGGRLEKDLGSLRFVALACVLSAFSTTAYFAGALPIWLVWKHVWWAKVCGFSGVLFGMVVVETFHSRHPSHVSLPMGLSAPKIATPFVLLILVQLVFWHASWLAHLAGILAGLFYVGFAGRVVHERVRDCECCLNVPLWVASPEECMFEFGCEGPDGMISGESLVPTGDEDDENPRPVLQIL